MSRFSKDLKELNPVGKATYFLGVATAITFVTGMCLLATPLAPIGVTMVLAGVGGFLGLGPLSSIADKIYKSVTSKKGSEQNHSDTKKSESKFVSSNTVIQEETKKAGRAAVITATLDSSAIKFVTDNHKKPSAIKCFFNSMANFFNTNSKKKSSPEPVVVENRFRHA